MEARIEELGGKVTRKIMAIEKRVERLEMVDYDIQKTIVFTDLPSINKKSDAHLVVTVLKEAGLGGIKVRNVKRLGDSTMVQCELRTIEEKIKLKIKSLKEKATIQDICGSFVRSAKSHVERTNEQNFKTLLKIIPGGQDCKIAANGKLMKKGWIRERDGSQMTGTQDDGHPSNHGGRGGRGGQGGNTSRGRGCGRSSNTPAGGNQRMVTSTSTYSVCSESPARSCIQEMFCIIQEERYVLRRFTSNKAELHNHGIEFIQKEISVNPNVSHPVIKNENSIRKYLRNNVKEFVSKKVYDAIYPSGSQPGKLYGLCKRHKPGLPFRPVVSMINTAEYHLAKYLDSIIKPHIPSEFMLDSTSSFLGKLKEFCFKPTDILISFDVSLFTNVPLAQTIDKIADHICELDSRPTFDKKTFTFKKLMHMATSGIFVYRER